MHLYTDAQIDTMKVDELKEAVQIHNLTHPDTDIEQLKTVLRTTQRTRYLTFWHDHATMLGRGYIMMTVHTIFDPAVFDSTREDDKDTVQTLVEEAYMYMFGLNSSSIEDQATLIVDRVDCLEEMDEPLIASNGVPVTDIIRFFVGDHPAKQFERGTQCGGVYKCGSCGCKSSLMDDQTHALQCSTRSLTELQALAIGGVLGKVPCTVKPLYVPDLVVKDIRKELVARGVKDVVKKRIELQKNLQEVLKGVQRVPSLLLLHPEKPLSDLSIDKYEIMDCEPLHDIKGHLLNLFAELPSILENPVKAACINRIKQCQSKEKKERGRSKICRDTDLSYHTSSTRCGLESHMPP